MKCVYKIVCRDTNITEFYIGSSMDFDGRKYAHKHYCNNTNSKAYCLPLYMFINVNGGYDNWKYEIIKEYKFINKKELNGNEQYYIDKLKPQLNIINAFGVDMEKKKKTKKKDLYIQNNKKVNCVHCGIEINRTSMYRHISRKHTEIV